MAKKEDHRIVLIIRMIENLHKGMFLMGKRVILLVVFFLACLVVRPVFGEDTAQPKTTELQQKIDKNQKPVQTPLQSLLAGLDFSGGISAGNFYTSHAGQGNDDNEWMLSNLLVEVSTKDQSALIGFTAAVGETSTPSLLGSPGTTNSIDVEYASLNLNPTPGLNVMVGLLRPNAGYENSYTYNNQNAFLGVIASQQPYNAYGIQVGYDFKGVHFVAGYYKDRLARDEYVTNDDTPNETWEFGVSGTILGTSVSLYHYRLESLRDLTGVVLERSFGTVDLGFNMDYWHWDGAMTRVHADDSSIGGAVYIIPHFGKFSLPMRLEYIDQGASGIYLDSTSAHRITAVTISPTYRFIAKAYIRADLGYVHADDGFSDDNGHPKSNRICLAAEIGYTF